MKATHPYKRHYKKLAAAFGSAAVLAASAIPGLAPFVTPKNVEPATPPGPVQEAPPVPAKKIAEKSLKEEENAKKVLQVKATAYAPGPHDNAQWGDKTHLGTKVRPGVIAVDPRIIPLGSKVMIKYPDGTKEYATAEDTGGAIKGHRIDVAKWTVKEANQFGIKAVKVYVLSTPEKKNESLI